MKELYSTLMDPTALDELVKECNIMVSLKHPAIVKLYGVGRDRRTDTFCIVMELAAGSLYDWVHRATPVAAREAEGACGAVLAAAADAHDPWHYSPRGLVRVFQEIASGMRYVHSVGIVHRDLKPSNILLDQSGHVRICDFGLSRYLAATARAVTGDAGTAQYMAPEMFEGRVATYANSIDVYAFGIMFWEACTRTLPYNEVYGQITVMSKAQSGARPPLPLAMPSDLRSLIQRCWSGEPCDRPSFVELEHMLAAELDLHDAGKRGKLIPSMSVLDNMQIEAVQMRSLPPGHETDLEALRAQEARLGLQAAATVAAFEERRMTAAVAGSSAMAGEQRHPEKDGGSAGEACKLDEPRAAAAMAITKHAGTRPAGASASGASSETIPTSSEAGMGGAAHPVGQSRSHDESASEPKSVASPALKSTPPLSMPAFGAPRALPSPGMAIPAFAHHSVSAVTAQAGWPSPLPFLDAQESPESFEVRGGQDSSVAPGLGFVASSESVDGGWGGPGIPMGRLGQLLVRQRSVGHVHRCAGPAARPRVRPTLAVGCTGGVIHGPVHQHWSRWSVNSLVPVDLSPTNILALEEEDTAAVALELMGERGVISCPVYRGHDAPADASSSVTSGSDASAAESPRDRSQARCDTAGTVATDASDSPASSGRIQNAAGGAGSALPSRPAEDALSSNGLGSSMLTAASRRSRAASTARGASRFDWVVPDLVGRGSMQQRFVQRRYTPRKCLVTRMVQVLDVAMVAVQAIAATPGAEQVAESFASAPDGSSLAGAAQGSSGEWHGTSAGVAASSPATAGASSSASALLARSKLSADGEAAFRVQAASQANGVLASLTILDAANASGRSLVVCITTGVPVPSIVRVMSSGCRRLMVLNKQGHVVGIPTVSALLQRLHKEPEAWEEVGQQRLSEALHLRRKPAVRTCLFHTPLWVALQQLHAVGADEFAVVDDDGRLRATLSASCMKMIGSAKDLMQPIHQSFGLSTTVGALDAPGDEAGAGLEAEIVVKLPVVVSRTSAIAQPSIAAEEVLAYRRDERFAAGGVRRVSASASALSKLLRKDTPGIAPGALPADDAAARGAVLLSPQSPPLQLGQAAENTASSVASGFATGAREAAAVAPAAAAATPLAALMQRCLRKELEKAASKPRDSVAGRLRRKTSRKVSSPADTVKEQYRGRSLAVVISKTDTLHHICGLFVRYKAQRLYLVDDQLRPQIAISPMDIIDCLATWLDEHESATAPPV